MSQSINIDPNTIIALIGLAEAAIPMVEHLASTIYTTIASLESSGAVPADQMAALRKKAYGAVDKLHEANERVRFNQVINL